jgi:hypothetical protein
MFARIPSWITSHWRTGAAIACVVGVAAACKRGLESEEARTQRKNCKQNKELRALAEKISAYGRNVHQCYPTGDVVIGEHDLADKFCKRREVVGAALNILLREQKAQRSPLAGYWKLNV